MKPITFNRESKMSAFVRGGSGDPPRNIKHTNANIAKEFVSWHRNR